MHPLGHISDGNGKAVFVADYDLADIAQRSHQSFAPDKGGHVIPFDVGSSCVQVVLFDCTENLGNGNAHGLEFVRIERHFVLLDIASERIDLYHSV